MYEYAVELIISLKYLGITIVMALFPSESIMPFVGSAASFGHLSLPAAVVAGTIGTSAGSIAVYLLARQASQETVYRFIDTRGKWLGLTRSNIERAGRWFDRHAGMTVFFGRFIPGIRTAVSVPAGFRRMPLGAFAGLTILGSAIDVLLLATIGYLAANRYDEIQNLINNTASAITACIGIAIAGSLLWRLWTHRRRAHDTI
ncbi:DedA family protein [Candidatus Saccharibacteria bacterium]|nr:DedA family protein [Candidatus Saccharibacteria bacterium]